MGKGEIVWVEDMTSRTVKIGYYKGTMYKISTDVLNRHIYNNRLPHLTPEEVLKLAIKESQYIPFEEVK